MKKNDLNDKIEQYLKIEGKVRGVVLQTDKNYILMTKGENGLKKVIKKAEEFGVELPYEKTSALEWIPAGYRLISILLIKEVFDFHDDDITHMGFIAPKTSFIVKIIMKFFVDLEKLVNKVPDYWKEHWTIGELCLIKFNKKEKKLILHLNEFKADPLFCTYLKGYFKKMLEFVVKIVDVKEIKCMNKGHDYHEFLVSWD